MCLNIFKKLQNIKNIPALRRGKVQEIQHSLHYTQNWKKKSINQTLLTSLKVKTSIFFINQTVNNKLLILFHIFPEITAQSYVKYKISNFLFYFDIIYIYINDSSRYHYQCSNKLVGEQIWDDGLNLRHNIFIYSYTIH